MALNAWPGVRSARFARPDASDDENVERLLRELDAVPNDERGARYVSELVLLLDREPAAPGRSRAGSARSGAVPKASATTRCSFRPATTGRWRSSAMPGSARTATARGRAGCASG